VLTNEQRYRLEKFEEASALYQQLLSRNPGIDNEADLRINSLAAAAQLEWAGTDRTVNKTWPSTGELDAFETTYNAACLTIARGDLGKAEIALKRARGTTAFNRWISSANRIPDLCNALEDLSDEDKLAETLPIMIQQLYVLIRQGRLEEAERLADGLPIAS
jgi:signal recognition particle subunit SRP72